MTTSDLDQFKCELLDMAPSLRKFAMSLCRDPSRADDLSQETMAKAWKSRSHFVRGTNFKAWLFTILHNAFVSDLRKGRLEVEDPGDEVVNRAPSIAGQDDHMNLLDLAKVLDALPSDQRQALMLVGADGHSYEDTALICCCAVGTVKSRVSRARIKLRELLGMDDSQAAPQHVHS